MKKVGFKIIGIAVRTTNKDNKAAEDLGNLWGQFHSKNIFEKIPNKISSDVYSIYTDYESDYMGAYTTIIGVPVANLDNIPDGLVGRAFPEENFLQYTAKGEMPMAVVNVWNEIWRNDAELNRQYSYDYEVYGVECQKGKDSEVQIFVAIP